MEVTEEKAEKEGGRAAETRALKREARKSKRVTKRRVNVKSKEKSNTIKARKL